MEAGSTPVTMLDNPDEVLCYITVHFRAMAVYPDLKPYLGALDIYLIVSATYIITK